MPEQIWTVWWAWVVLGFLLGILEIIAPGYIFLGIAIACAIAGLALLAVRFAAAHVGGHTGDIAGATQQVVEIAFLLTLLAAAP